VDVMQRRRELMGMQTGGLPGAYRRVEYLESTGTQYFWTDVNIQDGLTVDSVQMRPDIVQDSYLFGGIVSYNGNTYTSCFNGTYRYSVQGSYPKSYYNAGGVFAPNVKLNLVTTHKNGIITVYVDGSLIKNTTTGTSIIDSNEKCVCFGGRRSDGTVFELYSGRVYSLKVSKDNTLLSNFVPCVRKSDNKPGMYDTVSHTFYTNAGTGEFIVPN